MSIYSNDMSIEKDSSESDIQEILIDDNDFSLFQDIQFDDTPNSPSTSTSSSSSSSSPYSTHFNDLILTSTLEKKASFTIGTEEVSSHKVTDDYLLTRMKNMPNKKPLANRLSIRVLGVPNTGAKSRVETQIKLCIQLMSDEKNKASGYNYIKLNENMLAKSRLRKPSTTANKTLLDGSTTMAVVSDESKILHLEAQVVCASNTDQPIRMCEGCVRREKKRAERTKEKKSDIELSLEEIELEKDRILIFNCSPVINFSSGDVIIPTRIACYCRHHNEKLGFRIRFVMKDDTRNIIAEGMSPPIMITDDHKSNKQKTERDTTSRKKRKRSNDDVASKPDTPIASRKNSIVTSELLTPFETSSSFYDNTEEEMLSLSPTNLSDLISSTHTSFENLLQLQQEQQNDPSLFFNFVDTTTLMNHNESIPEEWMFNRRLKTMHEYTSPDNLDLLNQAFSENTSPEPVVPALPQLERLVPSQGPTYGGTEVTILGSGFYQGLTCLFGEHVATSTTFWNSSTMVCVLPPADRTGPVVVSFKEHPLVVDSRHDVAIFTYYDASDQALLELALQVVGLKMTGKLHDAKHVAMRIVQGDSGSNNDNSSNKNNTSSAQYDSHHKDRTVQTLTDALLVPGSHTSSSKQEKYDLTMTNSTGQTLLHFAVLLDNERLLNALLKYYDDDIQKKLKFLNMQDVNGMTALHFACQKSLIDSVRLLLYAGANPTLESKVFKKPLPASFVSAKDSEGLIGLLDLYGLKFTGPKKRKPLSRRMSVKSHMIHQFHSLTSCSHNDSNNDASQKKPAMESDGLGLIQQKLDRRLYVFWLPVLIVGVGLLCVQMLSQPHYLFKPILERLPSHLSSRIPLTAA